MKDVLRAVRAGWWLVAAAVLLGVVIAGTLSWLATPLYSSSTRLFVSTAGSTDAAAAYQGNLFSQERVTSYAQLLAGEQLAARVVGDLGLEMTPAQVAGEVTATPVPNTVILDVTVTDPSPRRAQRIAATLGQEFTRQVVELETPSGSSTSTVKVTVVQPAQLDLTPVSPRWPRNVALGGLLGLVVGLALALLRARLDNTVKTNEDVQATVGTGLIGAVLEDPKLREKHLVTDFDDHSVTSEEFRAIRTNLQFLNVDNPPKVIVVTSSAPGEGKSTLAVNLATALAQAGSRVTLVEADLRRPRVMRYMGLVSGAGLSNVLAGTADLGEVVQPWGDGKLQVLAAGPTPPNPSEILGSAQMRSLLQVLRETQDYVVIDTPPLLPVTDAAVLGVVADGCVITTRHGKTRREELAEAAATLARIDATLLGIVLNRVPQSASLARGYGYGYGYRADPGREAQPDARAGLHRRERRRSRRSRGDVAISGVSPAGPGERS